MVHRAEGETRADVARRYDEAHGLTHLDLDAHDDVDQGDAEDAGDHP
jgi:GTP-binding protein